jgi:phosphonate transport system permease protein
MAIVIHSIGAMGKLYSESIESIDPGPIEAITATGANRLQVILFAVLPQVVPQFLSFTMYRWDINVRLSTVIGLVGGGGIGFILIQHINLLQWNQAGTALWLIGIVVITMDYASAIIREKLV